MASLGKGKKLVYVSEDLLDQAAKVSRDEDISIGKLVETSLSQAIQINKLGYRSEQMSNFFSVLESNRVLGGLFMPSGILDYMLEHCGEKDLAQLRAMWFESGKWTGKYLGEKFSEPVDAFKRFLELSRWDLNEVHVANDPTGSVKVRCVSTVMSQENTNLLAKFVEGVILGLGYAIDQVDVLKGLIILVAKR